MFPVAIVTGSEVFLDVERELLKLYQLKQHFAFKYSYSIL
jgi:hypothetical protein